MPTRQTLFAILFILAVCCGTAATCSAGKLITLHNFNGADGSGPAAGVTLDGQGNVYGTTAFGEAAGQGSVYKIDLATGVFTNLVRLSTFIGAYPMAGVTFDSQGNLYGTTALGASDGLPQANTYGSVFEIAHGSGPFSTVVNFTGVDGSGPSGLSIDSQGNFYGTTELGGQYGSGTVFEISHSGTLTTLFNFKGPNVSNPVGGVVLDGQGNLYGVAGGGLGGSVYEINHLTGVYSTIAVFTGTNGSDPNGVAIDSHGNLFGTTAGGGLYGLGTAFEINHLTGVLHTLANFNGSNGSDPNGVTLDVHGNLYGTTYNGGSNKDGTLYEISNLTGVLTTLVSFTAANASPNGGLTIDTQGNLYGTSFGGGTGNDGSVFELAAPEPSTLVLLAISLACALPFALIRRGDSGRGK